MGKREVKSGKNEKRPRFRWLRVLGYAVGTVFLLVLIVVWGLSIPKVQSWLVNQADWILESQIETEVELEAVSVSLPGKLALNGLSIKDQQENSLLEMKSLRLSVFNFSLWKYIFSPRDSVSYLRINGVEFNEPNLSIYKKADGKMNFQYILDRFSSKKKKEKSRPLGIRLSDIIIADGRFSYIDSTTKYIDSARKGRFIGQNFRLRDLNLETSFEMRPKNQMFVDLNGLSGLEELSGLELSFLSFDLKNEVQEEDSTHNRLSIENFKLRTPESSLAGTLRFSDRGLFEVLKNPKQLAAAVSLLRGSVLSFSDARYFLGSRIPARGKVALNGVAFINDEQILAQNLSLGIGNKTRIAGRINIFNYNKRDDLRLDANFAKSRISLAELQQALPLLGLPDYLQAVKQLELKGTMKGSLKNFLVNMGMDTDLGGIAADLRVIQLNNAAKLAYEGNISTTNLNLNALGSKDLAVSKSLNVKGKVKGKGISLEQLDAFLDVQLTDSDVKGYQVDSAYARVDVAKKKVNGSLYYKDPEGVADVLLDLRLNESPAIYKVDGKVDNFNLQTYGISKDPILLTSKLHIDIKGDSLDVMDGEASLKNSTLVHKEKNDRIEVEELYFQATNNSASSKYFNLKSSLLDADIAGDFTYAHANELLQRLVTEARLYLTNNDSLIEDYYSNKTYDSLDLKVQVGIAAKDSLNSLLEFFDLPLTVGSGSFVQGLLVYEGSKRDDLQNEKINISYSGEYLSYKNIKAHQPFTEFTVIKPQGKNSFNVDGEFDADSMGIGSNINFEKLSLRTNSLENILRMSVDFVQKESKGVASFSSKTVFENDGNILTTFDSLSSLKIHGDTLTLNEDHLIAIKGQEVNIQNLVLQDDERYYRINGWVSDNPKDRLELQFNRFDLNTLQEFFPLQFDLDGFLGGSLNARSLLGKPIIELGARISAFEFEGFSYGNIFTRAIWADELDMVDLGAYLIKDNQDTTLNLLGTYNLNDSLSPMNFKLVSKNGIPLDYVKPFVAGELYDLKGKVGLDDFTITGKLDEPIVLGTGQFVDAGFGIKYFQTDYTFNGSVLFDNEHMNFQNIRVTDRLNNQAELYGDIRHRGFQEFKFNLQMASAKNFLFMDTKKQDNKYFYGKLILDEAIADITGDLQTISIQALTSFANGSVLNIPADYQSEFNRPDYIIFAGEEENNLTAKTELLGFDLNLTALATENLDVNIIFDERVGDIIRAKGEGDINMILDDKGTFSIYGDYTIKEGNYLFTMENLINKRFVVSENSKLVWDGDPFEGTMDIDAIYATLADFSAIAPNNNSRILTYVVMHMEGPLLQPQISLEIQFPGVNANTASSLISYIKSINEFDEQELNNQVFSLIVFNRFAPQGSLAGTDNAGLNVATDAVASTLSELLNNQLNYWISRATGDKLNVNLNTGVNRNAQNNLAINDINLQISAKLFGDRVTIERNGNLLEEYSTDNLEGIIGNISLTVRLLPGKDGGRGERNPSELVLEVFGRQDILERENAYQTGVGLFYKKDLDKLANIFKRREKAEKEKEIAPPDSSGG